MEGEIEILHHIFYKKSPQNNYLLNRSVIENNLYNKFFSDKNNVRKNVKLSILGPGSFIGE